MELPLQITDLSAPLKTRDDTILVLPLAHPSEPRQRALTLDLRDGRAQLAKIDLRPYAAEFHSRIAASKVAMGLAPNAFPYGLSTAEWNTYALSPHDHQANGNGARLIGLNMADRLLTLDPAGPRAFLRDPGVNNELLSTTNWSDPAPEELWFASWSIEDTLARIDGRGPEHIETAIWATPKSGGPPLEVWRGDFADSIHQLALSPDRRFLVVSELGLRPIGRPPAFGAGQDGLKAWKDFGDAGLYPSTALFLDLVTGAEWRLNSINTAGHILFDPEDPNLCYLSSHNIGLVNNKVAIFGKGSILRYRIGGGGPVLEHTYTAPDFHRITTQCLFRHRSRLLLGVTGYPATLFLFDARSGELVRRIVFGHSDPVGLNTGPHLCNRPPYGFAPSRDGEAAYIGGSGFLRVLNIADAAIRESWDFAKHSGEFDFTGHLSTLQL